MVSTKFERLVLIDCDINKIYLRFVFVLINQIRVMYPYYNY